MEGVSLGGFTYRILIDYIFNLFISSSSSHSPEKYAPVDDCQSELFTPMAKEIVLAGNGNSEDAMGCDGKTPGRTLGQGRLDRKPSSPTDRPCEP